MMRFADPVCPESSESLSVYEEGGLAAVRMREKEETVLTMLGIPRGASYVMEENE